MAIPLGEKRFFNYYRVDTIKMYADKYEWDLITAINMKEKFMDFVEKMDMSFSYKPLLLKAIFDHIDADGRVRICDIVNYFIDFYEERKDKGLSAEKAASIYQKCDYTEKDVERNILANPFKRFADMRFLKRCKDISMIEINKNIFKNLTKQDVINILSICDEKLNYYYRKI